jgi:hypothetical protein
MTKATGIGARGIGLAIARRQSTDRRVLLADFNDELIATGSNLVDDDVIAGIRAGRVEVGL